MRNLVLLLYTITFIFISCSSKENSEKEVVEVFNYNVIIAPDLSNRINNNIHPKPVNDTIILNSFYEAISSKFLKLSGRQTNQKDFYTIDFINRGALYSSPFKQIDFTLDFKKFGSNQLDRSNYIRKNLKSDIDLSKQKIKELYDYALKNPNGADLYGYLNNTVNNLIVDGKNEKISVTESLTANVSTKNVLIIFTDGYIENNTKDKGYQFTSNSIQKIRNDFKASGEKDLKKFISANNNYQINSLTNPKLDKLNVIVVEMIDRSLDKNGVALIHPTDFVIMREVWKQWFENSGVKSADFVEAQNDPEQVINRIEEFMKSL